MDDEKIKIVVDIPKEEYNTIKNAPIDWLEHVIADGIPLQMDGGRNKMYSIIFNNGKTININATGIEWYQSDKMARFLNGKELVARINMRDLVGWAKTDYIVKSEKDKNEDE